MTLNALTLFFFHKKSVFQVLAGVFLFFCRFDAQKFSCLFTDYTEKYAFLVHLDRFDCILSSIDDPDSSIGRALDRPASGRGQGSSPEFFWPFARDDLK